jgi:D-alanine-D-alanine ligase
VDGSGPEVVLPDGIGGDWRVVEDGQLRSLGAIDVVFPLLHGPFGEDGTIQGALELTDIRYVGAGVLASAVGMDKGFMKCVFEAHGLPVAPYTVITPVEWQRDRVRSEARALALGLPLFVKPCRAGSSLGITRVERAEQLGQAIDHAASHDPRVLVEVELRGREIECGVLGGRDGIPRATLPAEVVVDSTHAFYDFEAKYLDDAAVDLRCPADLPEEVIARLRDLAELAFAAITAEGLSRVDFFYDASAGPGRELTINEINTMPGFTPFSLFPQMAASVGLDYTALISELIDLALARPVGLR